jgi:hypothetical protein
LKPVLATCKRVIGAREAKAAESAAKQEKDRKAAGAMANSYG